MTIEQKFLVESIVERMVQYVMNDKGVTMLEAFSIVYNSKVYEKLSDVETGLCSQSPLYVYSFLKGSL